MDFKGLAERQVVAHGEREIGVNDPRVGLEIVSVQFLPFDDPGSAVRSRYWYGFVAVCDNVGIERS